MERIIEFGNEDWYNTISFIFASDDELNSVSTNEIVDIFNEYYDKFHTTRIENPLHDVIKSLIGKSLAEEMFGNKNSARISYESLYTKRQLFSELLKSFSKSQQFEILRHLFIKGKYKKTIDSENIKQFIDASTGFESLIKQYESMLESSDCDLEKKRGILNNMLRELEPLRERINKIDSKYDIIFNIGNNFHIRHNNIDGKNKKEALVKMTEDKISQAYDGLFSIIRIVWCYLQDEKLYNHIINLHTTLDTLDALQKEVNRKCPSA